MKVKLFVFALVLVLISGTMLAQSDRASITGTVKDSSGAVIPGVQVTVTNVKTNTASAVETNSLGTYSVLNLPIGTYTLSASKAGFSKFERTGITLAISQIAEINVQMNVGAATETVTVSEDAPLLNTQTAAISTNLTNAAVNELPLNVQGGRNLSNFMFAYVPGVEGSDYDSHIGGSLSKTKEVMIDGTSAVAQIGGYISESSPPMEAVEEFQVSTTGLRADEGRSGGGVFRYNMKSGTNSWHGSGIYFMHNEALNATAWDKNYNKSLCVSNAGSDSAEASSCARRFSKPDDRLYNYGANVNGPIVKDKLFFSASWERYTFANYGIGGLGSTVPTTAFLNGDFSALLDTNTVLGTDAAGQTIYKGAIFDPANPNHVFPGNIIPTARFSGVSRKIVDLYKQYYQPLSASLTNNNAMPLTNPATWYQSNQYSIKIDYNLNDKHRVYGSFIYAYIPRLLSDQGGIWSAGSQDGGPMANAYDHNTKSPSVRLSDSWTISNTMINVFGVTFNRFHNPSSARSQEGNWSSTLGLGNFGAGNFPIIKFQGVNGDQHRSVAGKFIDESQLGSQFNDFYTANTLIFSDNLFWVRGRHTFKFGGDLRIMQFNTHGDYGVPTFIFDPAQTAGTYGGDAGFGFASFLLGAANQASVSEVNQTYGRRKSLSLYAMDDIKVTPNFTLNVDLRWDFNGRYHEKFGRWSNFNPTLMNPVTGRPGALEFAKDGSDSFERNQYYRNFSGHIGGAYQITPKTVARASFGVFYVPLNLNTWGAIPYGFNPGFVNNNEYKTPFNWDGGYPGQAVDIGKDPNFTKWGMVSIDPRSLMLGNVQAWSVGVQQEVSRDLILEANFIQNHGYHLESGYLAGNQPNLANYTANVGNLWNWEPVPGAPGGWGSGWMNLTPFPAVASTWGPLFYVGSPLGNSDYQSLQFSVKKRNSHGLSMQASYSLSSAHGNTDNAFQELWWTGPLQDVYNLQEERKTIASFDQTHIVKGYVTYELPFGKGKAFLSDAGSGLNALIGGWNAAFGFHYSSGTPMRITANTWYPGINNVYSNINTNCNINQSYSGEVGGTYFNTACFSNPAYGAFGNAPGYLSQLRNPGVATEDLGLNKSIRFGDRYLLTLRYQMFNVFNRRSWGGPNTGIGTAEFGKVGTPDGQGHYYAVGGNPGPRVGQFGLRFSF
ncbi:MAG TPA: TonB-dependent receptor [Terriglobales bacterium]|nr:TonB-dependent receptor [Terriglobales bacterium]